MSVSFHELIVALDGEAVRSVLIGVAGANYYAPGPSAMFATRDRDLFLPLDPDNLVRAWQVCESLGLELASSDEPLDAPHDHWLAEKVIERRALISASDGQDLWIDLTLVMGGHSFDDVWRDSRVFVVHGARIRVARLRDIVTSKAEAGRPKDRLFLETHKEELRRLLEREGDQDH